MKKYLILPALILLVSCRVMFAPAYDTHIKDQVQFGREQTSIMYEIMGAAQDKNYPSYAATYSLIQNVITEVRVLDSTRAKGGKMFILAKDLQNRFTTYQQEHQARGTLNNSEILVYKDYMEVLWKLMYNAELKLKKSNP